MKAITIILLFLSTLTYSQENRFVESFAKADSAFTQQTQATDSLNLRLLQETITTIETMDQDTLEVPASQLLLMYWTGYIDGSLFAIEKAEFNFPQFKQAIDSQQQSLKSWIHFKTRIADVDPEPEKIKVED